MALFKIPFKSFKQLSTVQLIVLYYVSAILISTAILLFPPFLMPGVNVSLLDTFYLKEKTKVKCKKRKKKHYLCYNKHMENF